MEQQLTILRKQIDEIDHQILELLAKRMNTVRLVARVKKTTGMAILQKGRWQSVLDNRLAKGKSMNLSDKLIRSVWENIHTEALRIEEAL